MVLSKDIYDIYNKLQGQDKLLFTYYMLNDDFKSMMDMFVCHVSISDNHIIFESNYKKYINQTLKKMFLDGFIIESHMNIIDKSNRFKYIKCCNFIGFIQPICLN